MTLTVIRALVPRHRALFAQPIDNTNTQQKTTLSHQKTMKLLMSSHASYNSLHIKPAEAATETYNHPPTHSAIIIESHTLRIRVNIRGVFIKHFTREQI